MTPWKLIPLPYRILIIVAALVAALSFFFAVGYRYASASWEAKYQTRETELLADLGKAKDRARDLEREKVATNTKIDEAYQKGLTHAKAKTDRTIAGLRAGNVRLRNELAAAACGMSADAAGTGGGDGGAGADVWRAAAEDLVRLADEADGVVRQLAACQAVIQNYRASFQ